MIVDRLEAWMRAGMPTTPERVAWARAYSEAEGWAALAGNYVPGEAREERPAITLSSHFYCPRQLWLAGQGKAVKDVAPRNYANWYVGRMAEMSVVAACILAGLPVIGPLPGSNAQYRTSFPLAGKPRRGSIDLLLAHDLMDGPVASLEALRAYPKDGPVVLVDVKSMHDYGWDEAVKARAVGNKFGYEDQLNNYRLGLEREGRRVAAALFVCHKKSTGHWAEVPCEMPAGHQEYVEAACAQAEGPGLPERPSWATVRSVRAPGGAVTEIENVRCQYCDCLAACWPGYEQKIVSGKPVYRKPQEEAAK